MAKTARKTARKPSAKRSISHAPAPTLPLLTPTASTKELCQRLLREFPFKNYFPLGLDGPAHILSQVRRLLPPGGPHTGRILDIGSGPCDKTALLSWAGYQCDAIDDLADPWHRVGTNLQKIQTFATQAGITLTIADGTGTLPYPPATFDLVMLNDVIEHLPLSPRELVNAAISLLKPGGYLLVSVPSAVNIRKRLDVLRGRTNYPPYGLFYWSDGPWRGHIREYAKDDLVQLARYTGLHIETLTGCHHMLGVVPKPLQPLYKFVTNLFPNWRDSWLLIARRPPNWHSRAKATDATAFGFSATPIFHP